MSDTDAILDSPRVCELKRVKRKSQRVVLYAAGYMKCRCKESGNFYVRDLSDIAFLQSHGSKLHYDSKENWILQAVFCNRCFKSFAEQHPERFGRRTLVEDEPAVSHHTDAGTQTDTPPITIVATLPTPTPKPKPKPINIKESTKLLRENPFTSPMPFAASLEEFIDHLDSNCDQLATKMATFLGFEASSWKTDLGRRRRVIMVAIAMQAASLLDHTSSINYVKQHVLTTCESLTDTDKELLSALNLSFAPRHWRKKMIVTVDQSKVDLEARVASGAEVIILKLDDFNRVRVRGSPGSANTSKFSEAYTQANLAVKFYQKAPPNVSENFGETLAPLPRPEQPYIDFSVMSDPTKTDAEDFVLASLPSSTQYSSSLNYVDHFLESLDDRKFRTLYQFDLSTKAAQLKDFKIFAAVPNKMKTWQDVQTLVQLMMDFVREYPNGCTWVVGDYYVWVNVLKVIWGQPGRSLRTALLAWPDGMHIALNAQQALILWNFGLFMPIWGSAFPNFTVSVVKMRPERRVMLLSMIFLAWNECRQEMKALYETRKDQMTDVQRTFVEALLRVFDEDLPMALDAGNVMASGDMGKYRDVCTRLLPFFIRYGKKNYVNIILYILGNLHYFKGMKKEEVLRALRSFLPWASSEDLEVFHSVIRAALRPYDSENSAVVNTMFITAVSDIGASAFLAEAAKQNKLEKERRIAHSHLMGSFPASDASRGTAASGRATYYNEQLATMATYVTKIFERVMAVDGSFSIQGSKEKQHSASQKLVPGYQLMSDHSLTDAMEASPPKRRKENGTFSFVKPAPGVLAFISERILPLPFWSADLNLGSITKLEEYRAYDFVKQPEDRQPRQPVADNTPNAPNLEDRQPLGDITPKPNASASKVKPDKIEWLTVDSPVSKIIPACHCDSFQQDPCEHLMQEICVKHWKSWVTNLACTSGEVELEDDDGDDEE
ncbi:hypothetical protein DFS34DRAFT_659302 [Phlyctochytrium arcticum]|nr:hypothetical protein DFS34DRAFT_659302 [Phlyctochytrium arcticum]